MDTEKNRPSTRDNCAPFALWLLAASWACAAPLLAAETSVGDRTVKFDPPAGYCFLNERETIERDTIAALKDSQKPEGTLVWMFADCNELAALRGGSIQHLRRYGQVIAIKPHPTFEIGANMSRFDFAQNLGRNIPTLDIARIAAAARGREAAPDAPNHRLLHFGLAAIDAAAAYAGVLIENHAGSDRSVTAGIVALTHIEGLPLAIGLYGPYAELATYRALRNELRPVLGRLIARNDTSATRPRAANRGAEDWESQWHGLAQFDWRTALFSVLLSFGLTTLVVATARRLRQRTGSRNGVPGSAT